MALYITSDGKGIKHIYTQIHFGKQKEIRAYVTWKREKIITV